MDDEVESVALDAALVRRIKDRTEVTEFDSVQAYVEFAMAALLDEVEGEQTDPMSGADEDAVRDRLESLGYVEE